MSKPVIGFVGMTHLGINSAAASGAKGFATLCFDPDAALIGRLARGDVPVIEPDLNEALAAHADKFTYSSQAADLTACDVIYVAPDVPTDDSGASDLGPIEGLLAIVEAHRRDDSVLVVLSQVPPGFTRARQHPGRHTYYQVETLIFGRALERALYPERYIVGCADPARPLPPAYVAFLAAYGCPVLPMRYESAELAKISINMCLVSSISVANTLAELCEHIGADWGEIAPALKLDKRIGPHSYLAPGLGIAGGNLERDLATICRFADAHDTDAGVVRAWVANSRHRRDWAAQTLRRLSPRLPAHATVAVWGLAYKENTHSIKNSPSLNTIAQLDPGFDVVVHDPVVAASVVPHPRVRAGVSALAAVHGADVLMILTPWPEYRDVPLHALASAMKGRIVLDPYKVLPAMAAKDFEYHTLGVGPDEGKLLS